MERLLYLWDELDEALGLLRHLWLTALAKLTPVPVRVPRRPAAWTDAPRPRGT